MNACCGEQKRNERLKLALQWTISQRVSVVQRCARAEGVIFQQDGAAPHYGNIVREFLDTTFPQRRGAVMRITDVIHSVAPDVITRVWEELDYRLDVCRATNGAHIELP
ncbi:hypothetical protein AVEN_242249-1 [Araneus ventricosus]|uniref:Tc1-like transposase DDE domain-containing protein n=1 Tax=Araneus ventricosus TaxID=182803 RepID=A0A4Y2LBY7_ARAVE|nr:hypothetical protein AVEN_242249-1 [Araneus ventricosus]